MMKHTLLFLLIGLCGNSFSQTKDIVFTVTNPLPLSRQQETVSLDVKGLYQHHPELVGVKVSVYENKSELISQFVDNNLDSRNDELIFQASFKPNESKQFSIHAAETSAHVQTMVDGKYVLPREDFAWENDRIAFRVYGSVLAGNVDNGIDVWTKRVRYPIIQHWYAGEEQTPKIVYHEDHGEGADFFSVGKSLGAGSSGILWNGKLIQSGLFTHHRVIANGPIRISFELYYPNIKLDTAKYLLVKRITLDAGEQLNKIEEHYISNSTKETLTVVSGLVKRPNTELKRSPDNRRMSLWGLTNADSINGYLGTAVLFPYSSTVSAREDSIQYYLSSSTGRKNSFTYFSGAAWTRMGDFTYEKEWVQYLDTFVTRVHHPLIISFQQKKK